MKNYPNDIDYIPTPSSTVNPKWRRRNYKISKLINPNSKVLDLGCGSKNLLEYLDAPKKYIGIDYKQPLADIEINFNYNFKLPKENWDFIVCSGLLEYLKNIKHFFQHVKNNSVSYIFTFSQSNELRKSLGNPNGLNSVNDFEIILKTYFEIKEQVALKTHTIYLCKDIIDV